MDVAYMPVTNADRLGAHMGQVLNTLVYRIPWAASSSRFGVRTRGVP